ncbi:class I SAM-dependent methyltransferase [Vicingus serpentipes]|jgi:2-polyprenyl-3-methyl-5-hydroxy-6-metoxy-1,4-benzoquinol methylase|uniref:Class I SAM-dependent methyltransferase n=1 Tax=Vicingus serpentipes TaxID=1926625 RepID=A0A5C6RXR8_9FLAO|nr:class I SAM-dependent methyltransferase [Vicingus serpentipes]TXB66973.1 class I SAM-dependent methyltransferase [Vicingus serpentipes]
MKTIILSSIITLMVSSTVFAQQHHHKKDENNTTNLANEHMHQSSTEELIKRFESPERDAYQQPEKVLNYLEPLKGKKVIDIGAGSGYFSVKLAKQGAIVIAADVSDELQAALKNRIEENKLQNIELRKIPYDSPSLANNEVDIALIVNTYHHIENRSEYFSKVKKGIVANGELVIIDFFKTDVPVGPPTNHKVSIDEVIAELKKAGYINFEVNVDLLPYQYIIKAK